MKTQDIWWIILLRGIALVLFGFIAFAWPAITLVSLAYIFALYILVSGVINIIHAFSGFHFHSYWFLRLILGIFEIGVGAYAFANPAISLSAFILLIGLTFMIRGLFEVIIAFEAMYQGFSRALLLIAGIISIFAGFIILRYPVSGGLAFTWILGVYALIGGAMIIALSIVTKEVLAEKK